MKLLRISIVLLTFVTSSTGQFDTMNGLHTLLDKINARKNAYVSERNIIREPNVVVVNELEDDTKVLQLFGHDMREIFKPFVVSANDKPNSVAGQTNANKETITASKEIAEPNTDIGDEDKTVNTNEANTDDRNNMRTSKADDDRRVKAEQDNMLGAGEISAECLEDYATAISYVNTSSPDTSNLWALYSKYESHHVLFQ